MEFDMEVCCLSRQFYQAYPRQQYPEILQKEQRPYSCLLTSYDENTFLCIPFRTNMNHKNGYHFRGSKRCQEHQSGLDYGKMALIQKKDYISTQTVVVDQDEYKEAVQNMKRIVRGAVRYIDTYKKHITGESPLHQRAYAREYGFSTLPYFHNILGLADNEWKAVVNR